VAQLAALVIERERLLREHAEAQANELALRAANKQMDDFLSMASHELRTPLTSVKAYVQVAQRRLRQPPDETAPVDVAARLTQRIEAALLPLERASAHSDVLNRLVGDLLDASRIQAHHLDMRMAPCDLAELAQEVVEEQQLAWPERVILLEGAAHAGSRRLSATSADDARDRSGVSQVPGVSQSPHVGLIAGDAARLKQVIANYLTNALKYAPADQPITVGMEIEAEHVGVFVRDRGPGLPLEEQQRIWERFHRSAGVRTQNGAESGLGLGLYICRGIIELHGGTVGLASAPGEGCVFSFTLPRVSSLAP
jgi:signal transduction histidine kinase